MFREKTVPSAVRNNERSLKNVCKRSWKKRVSKEKKTSERPTNLEGGGYQNRPTAKNDQEGSKLHFRQSYRGKE